MFKEKKNVIFLEQYGSLGGGQQILLELVGTALKEGYVVTVMIPEGPCVKKLLSLGAKIILVTECVLSQGKKNLTDICRYFLYSCVIFGKYRDILRDANLIYVNGGRMCLIAMFSQIFFKTKTIFHIHLYYGKLEQKLFILALRMRTTRALVLPSEFIHHSLVSSHAIFSDKRVCVVPNGLDKRFNNIRYVDRFSRKIQNIGVIGRVSPEKGQDIVILLAKKFVSLKFHILGDAAFSEQSYYEMLKAQAPANVTFHGWIEDIPTKIQQIGLQICLVPSRCFEAAPLVPLQMTALSCLVVVRSIGALKEIADTLKLITFKEDYELENLLNDITVSPYEVLRQKIETSYNICMQKFSNNVFNKNLDKMVKEYF